MTGSNSDSPLRRQLGLFDAVAIYVGIIVGSGIFIAPSSVAAVAADPMSAAMVWIAGGLIAACGALCYAECGARLPHNGGFYIFYREVYGEPVAFVGGWAALAVTYPASVAAIAIIFANYAGQVIPALVGHETLAATCALVTVGALNIVGVRVGVWSQRILTTVKVGALALICVAAVVSSDNVASGSLSSSEASGPPTVSLAAILLALVGVLWTYSGWSDVTLVSGEIKNPARNLGRTVLWGTLTIILLYTLVQTAVMSLLSAGAAATSKRVFADAIEQAWGSGAGRLVAALIVVSTIGAINGTVLVASRLGYAMARDRVMPSWFGSVHPRWRTPARSVGALTFASVIYVAFTDFNQILGIFTFSVWIFYALTAIALIILRRRAVGEPLAWQAPFGLLSPAVVLATGIAMTASLLTDPSHRELALTGLLLLTAGVPAYFLWTRLRR